MSTYLTFAVNFLKSEPRKMIYDTWLTISKYVHNIPVINRYYKENEQKDKEIQSGLFNYSKEQDVSSNTLQLGLDNKNDNEIDQSSIINNTSVIMKEYVNQFEEKNFQVDNSEEKINKFIYSTNDETKLPSLTDEKEFDMLNDINNLGSPGLSLFFGNKYSYSRDTIINVMAEHLKDKFDKVIYIECEDMDPTYTFRQIKKMEKESRILLILSYFHLTYHLEQNIIHFLTEKNKSSLWLVAQNINDIHTLLNKNIVKNIGIHQECNELEYKRYHELINDFKLSNIDYNQLKKNMIKISKFSTSILINGEWYYKSDTTININFIRSCIPSIKTYTFDLIPPKL